MRVYYHSLIPCQIECVASVRVCVVQGHDKHCTSLALGNSDNAWINNR